MLKKRPTYRDSLQEHPILKQPFYMLHPCQTAEVMALLTPAVQPSLPRKELAEDKMGKGDSESLYDCQGGESNQAVHFLKAWFSVYGCAVGLKLPRALWP